MEHYIQTPYPTFLQQPKKDDEVRMIIEEVEPIPPNSNPFLHDAFRMGCSVAGDVMAMFSTPGKDEAVTDFRLVKQATGQVFKIWSVPKDPVPKMLIDVDVGFQRVLGVIGNSIGGWGSNRNRLLPVNQNVRRLGGPGLENVFGRTDDGLPLIYQSKLGTFYIPLYFGYGGTAMLLSAIPYELIDGVVTITEKKKPELQDILFEEGLESDEVREFIDELIFFVEKDLPYIT